MMGIMPMVVIVLEFVKAVWLVNRIWLSFMKIYGLPYVVAW